jgi:hypothetical protein
MVADFLLRDDLSRAAAEDPIGDESLNDAKKIRRRVLMAGGWQSSEVILATADQHFPLPTGPTRLWEERGASSPEAIDSVERAIRQSRAKDPPDLDLIFG